MKPGCSLEPFPLSAVRLRCRHASPDGTRSRPHFPPELGPFLLSLRSLAYTASARSRREGRNGVWAKLPVSWLYRTKPFSGHDENILK